MGAWFASLSVAAFLALQGPGLLAQSGSDAVDTLSHRIDRIELRVDAEIQARNDANARILDIIDRTANRITVLETEATFILMGMGTILSAILWEVVNRTRTFIRRRNGKHTRHGDNDR